MTKNNSALAPLEIEGSEQTFSLLRRAHTFAVEGNLVKGTIILTTEQALVDEVPAATALEKAIASGAVQTFGGGDTFVRSIGFNWTPAEQDKALYGSETACVITLNYVSARHWTGSALAGKIAFGGLSSHRGKR